MHIESLRYFRRVVEAKSISKVANKSHISQSALSQMIQKIEDSLGYKLLERSNRGVIPTPMGQIVLKYSGNIIKSYETMQKELEDMEKNTHTIRITADSTLVTYSLPCVLYKIRKKYPKHKYELASSVMDQIVTDVRNDICDMGVTNGKPDATDLEVTKIGHEDVVLVGSKNLNIPDEILVEDLFKYDIIALNTSNFISHQLNNELKRYNYSANDLNILFNTDSIGAVKSSIHNGYGISFLPYMAIKKELYTKEYKAITIKDFDLSYDIYLLTKPHAVLSKSSGETIDYFLEMGENSFC